MGYRDNGKENGNYCAIVGNIMGCIGDTGRKWKLQYSAWLRSRVSEVGSFGCGAREE